MPKKIGSKSDWLIRQIAEGDASLDAAAIRCLAEQLSVDFDPKGSFCMAFRYADYYAPLRDASMTQNLLHACQSVAKQGMCCYIGNYLYVVVIADAQVRKSNVLEKLYQQVSRHCPCEIQMGVGRVYSNLEKLSYSRVEAYEALNNLSADGKISYIDDVYATRDITTSKHNREKRQILELFKKGKIEQLKKNTEQLVENVRAESPVHPGQPYPTSIRRTVAELLFEIMHIGADAGVDVDKLLAYQDPYSKVFEMRDTPSILAWFFDVVALILKGMSEQNSKSTNNLLGLAKKEIEEHLFDPELSLSLVSDALEITPAYFSAFFIREVGIGFNEYITGLRVEQAKKLLEQTNKKVSDIALQCGFRSSSYFIVVFRKQTGMSPKEYQNMKNSNK